MKNKKYKKYVNILIFFNINDSIPSEIYKNAIKLRKYYYNDLAFSFTINVSISEMFY